MVSCVSRCKQKAATPPVRRGFSAHVPMLLTLLTALGCGRGSVAAASPGTGPQTAGKSPTNYAVHVDVREIQNRVVEGTVRGHRLIVDQPKPFGGDDTAPTPPETLAFALGSCVVSTGRLLVKQLGLDVTKLGAIVDGELDFAKALGMPNAGRAGFRGFRVLVTIEGSLADQDKRLLLTQIQERCPMCDNLAEKTPLDMALKP